MRSRHDNFLEHVRHQCRSNSYAAACGTSFYKYKNRKLQTWHSSIGLYTLSNVCKFPSAPPYIQLRTRTFDTNIFVNQDRTRTISGIILYYYNDSEIQYNIFRKLLLWHKCQSIRCKPDLKYSKQSSLRTNNPRNRHVTSVFDCVRNIFVGKG